MSTSRSIASAINRRAGNNVPRPNQPQQAFNPKLTQTQGQGQQIPKNVRFVPSGQGANPIPQQQPQQQKRPLFQEPTIPVKTAGVNGPVGQVSISDAFALVTIRLGRVEQYIQQIQEEGVPSSNQDTNSQLPDNQMIIDLQNTQIMLHNQKDLLQSQQEVIQTLTQKVNEYETIFTKYDNTLKNLKDMLMILSVKTEKNIIETNTIFSKMESNLSLVESLKSQIDTQSDVQTELQNKLELYIQNKPIQTLKTELESETQNQIDSEITSEIKKNESDIESRVEVENN